MLRSEKGGRQGKVWWFPTRVKVNEGQWQTKVKNGFKFILVECPVKNFDAASL